MIPSAYSLYSLKERLIGKLFRITYTNPSDGENALILPPADLSGFGANINQCVPSNPLSACEFREDQIKKML